jgi:hypothetical protein
MQTHAAGDPAGLHFLHDNELKGDEEDFYLLRYSAM